MSRHLKFVSLLAAVLLLAVSAVSADTLEMKDGRVIHGKYMGGTQHNIRFETDGRVDLYPVTDVVTLTIDTRSRMAGAPAPPPAPADSMPPPAQADNTPPPQPRSDSDRPALRRRPSAVTVNPSADDPPPAPRAASGSATVPAGARLVVRMIDGVDSDNNRVGDRFHASLVEDLVSDDNTLVAPKGTDVYGRLTDANQAGRIQGRSELRLELTDIMIGSRLQPLQTGDYQVSGNSRGTDTAKKTAGGAALGAIIGAVAGGGKGAAIGAGVGGAAGAGTQVFTRGQKVKVPPETVLDFTLQQPLAVQATAPPAQ